MDWSVNLSFDPTPLRRPPPPFPHSCHAGHVFVSTSSSIFGVAVISTCFLALETRSSIQLISCHFAFWPLIFLLRHNRIICWFIYPHFPLCRSVFSFFSVPVPSQLYSSPPLVRVKTRNEITFPWGTYSGFQNLIWPSNMTTFAYHTHND